MTHRSSVPLFVLLFLSFTASSVQSQLALGAKEALPITEVTVFKDGHALVIHEGHVTPDKDGRVLFTDLPSPLLGTFWPTSFDSGRRLVAVRAGERDVETTTPAESLAELIKANPGAEVLLREKDQASYPCRLSSGKGGPIRGNLLHVDFEMRERVIPLELVRDITFLDPKSMKEAPRVTKSRVIEIEFEPTDTQKSVHAGLSYVQSGLRWIPSYRVTLDGEGAARVELRATLVNDLRNLHNCRVNLVVGVPSFEFKNQLDPMGLSDLVRAVMENPMFVNNPIASNFANNIMNSQVASFGDASQGASQGGTTMDPGVVASEAQSNLFFYTLKGITLKRGERMSVMVGTFDLEYEDVYTLDLPFQEYRGTSYSRGNANADLWSRLAKAPKIQHLVELRNSTNGPLTTAPAMVIDRGRVIAQGMLRYTPTGGKCRIPMTSVIDVRVSVEDLEVARFPGTLELDTVKYHRVELDGKVSLRSLSKKPMRVQVSRYLIGRADSTPQGGTRTTIGTSDELTEFEWGNLSRSSLSTWPGWWSHVNALERFRWTVDVDPGKTVDLEYKWAYYWR
jgi:hypothetical protein